ncbi:ubiquitin-protein ligase E3B-like [Dysidea avara]|uniref:ubiquitin-protein ligase E3B-like n=1 Tax=Dysidea avara TaxID=196820 RepID=UPI003323B89F
MSQDVHSNKRKEDTIVEAQRAREERQNVKARQSAAITIQKFMRRQAGLIKVVKILRQEVDEFLSDPNSSTQPGVELFLVARKVLFLRKYHSCKEDNKVFERLCQLLIRSMESDHVKIWYVSVALNKTYAVAWIRQIKIVLVTVSQQLSTLKPGSPKDNPTITLYLHMLLLFTDYTLWKISEKAGAPLKATLHKLCLATISHLVKNNLYKIMKELLLTGLGSPQPGLSQHSLSAATTIRMLSLCQYPSEMMSLFTSHVMTAPGLIFHMNKHSSESVNKLVEAGVLVKCVEVLKTDSVWEMISSSGSFCLLGNVIQLYYLHKQGLPHSNKTLLIESLLKILDYCPSSSSSCQKQSSHTYYMHPIFGSIKETVDQRYLDSVACVMEQVRLLCHHHFIEQLFAVVMATTPSPALVPVQQKKGVVSKFSVWRHLTAAAKMTAAITPQEKEPLLVESRLVCKLYHKCISLFSQGVRVDLLTGLSCHGHLVSSLWHTLSGWYPGGSKVLLQAIRTNKAEDFLDVLALFCHCSSHLLVILDDTEFYDKQEFFTLAELQELASLLNHIIFVCVWENVIIDTTILSSCRDLLSILYDRDTRRQFAPQDHWLIKELKVTQFMSEFKATKPRALRLYQTLPHALLHRKRIELFREQVKMDRSSLGLINADNRPVVVSYITIHRNSLLSDSYAELAGISSRCLKGVIRVKFINEQGLEEAGIDEAGVFKEFLEEVVKKAFNPDLGLFKENGDGRIYPSPTSFIQEDHLSLFECVGKILGKAIYEGILMDVPFATFLLNMMCGRRYGSMYSSLDELSSLDPALDKSLHFIKDYDGDVSDLCLTFSWEEELMGSTVTHDLKPGGRSIAVTNENRISYVHLMARFKLYTQLKEQLSAFIRGFRALIPEEWTSCFSGPELQRLISGDNVEIDVDDLKRHVRYYGGYHGQHKVIMWLWDVVKNDLNHEEKAAFLKFVTSCSKPPLLGFAHMKPPFSVRCVQTTEEEDRGDTVGSVLRGIFSVSKKQSTDRLPTASTCFNLLKLPNYNKKGVLREKLRYAILSKAGFELS